MAWGSKKCGQPAVMRGTPAVGEGSGLEHGGIAKDHSGQDSDTDQERHLAGARDAVVASLDAMRVAGRVWGFQLGRCPAPEPFPGFFAHGDAHEVLAAGSREEAAEHVDRERVFQPFPDLPHGPAFVLGGDEGHEPFAVVVGS
ncbi:hypothetical protein [Streptomyces hirsutus]|uniref:hypothetical protein n=1 Tax=Streptomyces hirsutus TaxID=35620 RepID=UPI0036B93D0F